MATFTATIREGAVYTADVTGRGHTLVLDEPVEKDGADLGPTPVEAVSAALAACSAITIKMYARRKGWPLDGVEVTVDHQKIVDEAQQAAGVTVMIDQFRQTIRLCGPLTDDQKRRIMEIAAKCPVHKILEGTPRIIEELAD